MRFDTRDPYAEVIEDANGEKVQTLFSARRPLYMQLGEPTPDAASAEDALSAAHLDNWNLRLVPDLAWVEDRMVNSPKERRVVRDNPVTGEIDVLGHVGKDYGLVSNEDAFAFLDAFGELGDAKFVQAGSIDGGKQVFMVMELPGQMRVADLDPIGTYLLATTRHDGRGAMEAVVLMNQLYCSNAINVSLKTAQRRLKIRHTRNARERMGQAAELLSVTNGYVHSFKASAERLAEVSMTRREVDNFLAELFPVAKDAKARGESVADQRRTEVAALHRQSETIVDELRETAWGVFSAATEWESWYRPVRGAQDANVRRAERQVIGSQGSAFETRALGLLLKV